jgi:hypothetical protein
MVLCTACSRLHKLQIPSDAILAVVDQRHFVAGELQVSQTQRLVQHSEDMRDRAQ